MQLKLAVQLVKQLLVGNICNLYSVNKRTKRALFGAFFFLRRGGIVWHNRLFLPKGKFLLTLGNLMIYFYRAVKNDEKEACKEIKFTEREKYENKRFSKHYKKDT